MTISVTPLINFRNKTNSNGFYSIYLRVTINRQQRYYKVKIPQKVTLKQWSGETDQWIRNSHPYAFEINNKINEKKTVVMNLIKRCYNLNKPVTFYLIDRELNRKGDRSILNDYVKDYITRPPENVVLTEVTWEKYTAFLKHLNDFQVKIPFSEVDDVFIARFRNYLASLSGRNGKMNPATIKSYFDKLKVVLMHAAKKDNLLDRQQVEYFFEEVKITVPRKKEGQHLDIKEVQDLKKLIFVEKDRSLERDRDLFLFQVYTGFYYNDLQTLKKDQLFIDSEYGQYIIGERDKNGNPTIIPLFKFPYGAEIIKKYRDFDPKRTELFRSDCFVEVQVYNRNLKILAKRAAIVHTLSNKTGRHTNAQMWIRFGAERPVLSKMMGHEKEQTTENYYRVGLREVIEGTKSINFEKLAI
ncbi:MAG TPA: phage integrase SAM-like domain-containing protein [Puia sp.]